MSPLALPIAVNASPRFSLLYAVGGVMVVSCRTEVRVRLNDNLIPFEDHVGAVRVGHSDHWETESDLVVS